MGANDQPRPASPLPAPRGSDDVRLGELLQVAAPQDLYDNPTLAALTDALVARQAAADAGPFPRALRRLHRHRDHAQHGGVQAVGLRRVVGGVGALLQRGHEGQRPFQHAHHRQVPHDTWRNDIVVIAGIGMSA